MRVMCDEHQQKEPHVVIWKYPAPEGDWFRLEVPRGAVILSIQTQGRQGVIWMLVDPDVEKETREFVTIGTGRRFVAFVQGDHLIYESGKLHYLGTFQIDPLVWHLFENLRKGDRNV